ncbi:hypothetical protein FO488_05925 [Geobacter sp. FeAm09]|uniref:hypothetical protein n=1 Tax=Geobacter sp. FeAm09 TaxID=2597769 RepID=UPI0011ECB04F|nr:hypothetical protein [Geobacter sp. FeAm09]QEM67736.1 hypothetical protein FO488_05925 [Geobacter sp. FeAm09]
MKRRLLVLSAVALAALLAVAPAAAAGDGETPQDTTPQKDSCLLVAMNCTNETDTLNQRIDRLNAEIMKGTDVYTPEELDMLKRQLGDERKEFHDLMRPGDGGHHTVHGR